MAQFPYVPLVPVSGRTSLIAFPRLTRFGFRAICLLLAIAISGCARASGPPLIIGGIGGAMMEASIGDPIQWTVSASFECANDGERVPATCARKFMDDLDQELPQALNGLEPTIDYNPLRQTIDVEVEDPVADSVGNIVADYIISTRISPRLTDEWDSTVVIRLLLVGELSFRSRDVKLLQIEWDYDGRLHDLFSKINAAILSVMSDQVNTYEAADSLDSQGGQSEET